VSSVSPLMVEEHLVLDNDAVHTHDPLGVVRDGDFDAPPVPSSIFPSWMDVVPGSKGKDSCLFCR
jgi:hypothetical protein